MEKIKDQKNIFNRKTIIYLFIFIIFSFLPLLKVQAADLLLNTSFTGPTSGTVTTSTKILNFSFTFTTPEIADIPTTPNLYYNVKFQPLCDGVITTVGSAYIYQEAKVAVLPNKTKTIPWNAPFQCPLGTKTYGWTLKEVNSAGTVLGTYVNTSFTLAVDTNYQGWYYIYQKPNGTYYLFSVAGRFADQQLCTTDADNFVAQNPDYTIYRACQHYDSIPETDTAEFVNISAQKNTTSTGTYKLLAPIGGLKEAPANIGDYFNKIFLIAIGLCGALAVIMIVIGGVQYMGDESIFGKTEAKSKIMSAILGLLIALGAYVLLNTINPDLLGKSGVNIKQVSAEITEAPILSDVGKTVPVGTKNSFSGCPGGVSSTPTKGGTFIFCTSFASNLQKMFTDAYTSGIILSGGGFRTYNEQVVARTANCPAPILTVPASSCKPPTAIPGTSNHEQGLALDLKCDGFLINWDDQQKKYTKTPATKKCFDWLTTNASKYGFSNLAIENWHWSTGPNAGH